MRLARFLLLTALFLGAIAVSHTTSAAPRATAVPPNASGAASPRAAVSNTVVVIDAGHGGFDHGGIPGQRVMESQMTLDVALRLRTALQASGYHVVMTRSTDVFVPLGNTRGHRKFLPQRHLCLHSLQLRHAACRQWNRNLFLQQSEPALASAIHYYVAGGAPSPNRGVRRRGYFVLRRTTIPAILVECGFLTNPYEASYVQSAAYRQKLADEIARGVRNRGSVANSRVTNAPASESLATAAEAVPLQPFLDQTHVHDPDLSRSKHGKKSTSKSKKSSSSHSKKKKSSSSDDSSTKKKKPASSED